MVLACLLLALGAWAQKVRTMGDVDSLVGVVYNTYQKQWDALNGQYEAADSVRRLSIYKQYTQSELKCNAEVLALYAKYPKLEGAAERYFRLRGAMGKKELEKLYVKLPAAERASSAYAKGIRNHLDTRQIGLGDTVGTFRAVMPHGVEFKFGDLSQLKDVLLIFGGWNSIGRDMQLMLQLMYRKVDLSKLELVSIFGSTDRSSFEASVRAAALPWVSVSDLKGELSPLNIAFGIQATPVCVYISKGGRVEEITLGVNDSILARIQEQSYGQSVGIQ